MYWNGKPSKLVDVCLERVNKLHPDFNIKVLNTSIEKVNGYDSLSVQAQSDWVRICAIEKYGGIWLDASCFLLKPVDEWIDMNKMRLQGFSVPFADDCLESWAFAAPQNDELVRVWKKQFKLAIEIGFDKFKQESLLNNHAIFDHMPYLTIHGCYVIASNVTNMEALMKKSVDGPYIYLDKTNWHTNEAIDYLLERDIDVPFIKFRGPERNYLENNTYKLFSFLLKYHVNEKYYYENYNIQMLAIFFVLIYLCLIFINT